VQPSGLGTAQKYGNSYERAAKSIRGFVSGERLMMAREQFFGTLVLSVMVWYRAAPYAGADAAERLAACGPILPK